MERYSNYNIRQKKKGEYFYQPYGSGFHLYRVTSSDESGTVSERAKGEFFMTRKEARKRVYELNGWKEN